MKFKLIITAFILVISGNLLSQTVISLSEVATKVKKENYSLLQNAQVVYQAKETINFKKRNLLPKLNFWRILSIPFDYASAIDIVQDIAPFLIPNNWFSLKQSEIFYLTQKEQYRALWANQVMTAKLLYINALRDERFHAGLLEQQKNLHELIEILKTREIFGEVLPQVLKFLTVKFLAIQDDLRVIENLIFEEKKALAFLMGIPQENEITLEAIVFPNIEALVPIKFETFIFRAINTAPEVAQYDYLKKALKYTKKEIYFSILGSSTTSRGIGNSIFNNIPVQDGLGFGTQSSIKIANSEDKILDINKAATQEVIKQTLANLVNNYNSYLKNLENQKQREKLALQNYDAIKTQIILGQSYDPLEMLQAIQNIFDATISLNNYRYEIIVTIEKIQRVMFNEDYEKEESMLEEILKGEKL